MRFQLLLILCLTSLCARGQDRPSELNLSSVETLTTLDSVQNNFYRSADSLKTEYRFKLAKLDSSKNQLQSKIDSLASLNLSAEKYTAKLDSINGRYTQTVSSLNDKMETLKSNSVDKIKELQLPPELQGKASAITKNVEGFKLPVKDFNIPTLDVDNLNAGVDNPLNSLDGLNTSIDSPIGKVGEIDGLKDIQGSLGNVSEITDKVGEIQNLTNGNLQEQIPQVLETKAGEAVGLDKLKEQTGAASSLLNQAQNPEAAKAEIIDQAQQQAVNHFSGQEEALKNAMKQMSKLKQKYSSLNSLSELPKRRPNEMRNKKLRERLVPGIALQIFKKGDDFTIDFNPYVGYRFTGRLNAGPGWVQRFAYDTNLDQFNPSARIYGPRIYAEYKLGKGFAPRVEGEIVNAFVPPKFANQPDIIGSRQWVSGAFAGIKKEFKLSKRVNGTSLIMFRLINTDHKSPYTDVVNVRVGFEFPQKKKNRINTTEKTN